MNYDLVDILLVEDNAEDAELTIRQLKKQNLATNLAHVFDGEQALEFIAGTGKFESRKDTLRHPKLIILDIHMPKVTGIEVLQKLKDDGKTRCIPVVVLTSSKEDFDIKKCYDLGVNSYIVKPVDFEDFSNVIKNLGNYWLLLNLTPF